MDIVGSLGIGLLYLFLIIGLCIIPLGFPGTWLMVVASILFALVGDIHPGGSEWVALLIITAIAALGELVELGVRIVGSKVAHVPNGAIVCAILGGLIGAIVGVPVFLIGSLLGLLLGVFLGAFLYALFMEGRFGAAFWMALATTTSQVVALFAKTCMGLAIVVYLTFILF